MGKREARLSLNIPIEGNNSTVFFCKDCGFSIASGYNRVVIGGRGPYIEFEEIHVRGTIDLTNNYHKFFDEYVSICKDKIFVYFQLKTVSYADYVVGKFYISPDLLTFATPENENRIICIDYAKGHQKDLF